MAELQKVPPLKASGLAARNDSGRLSPLTVYRRAPGKEEVTIKVLYCGLCPADRRSITCRRSRFPLVPGHEIVGEVIEVGDKESSKFKVGDNVGVGCMIGHMHSCFADKSCRCFDNSKNCLIKPEKYCSKTIRTYCDGSQRYGPGGLSEIVVVKERFMIMLPKKLLLNDVAPLLCAGVTLYCPMKFYGLDKCGLHLGVIGLGLLGQLALKFAKAFGLKITLISASQDDKKEAVKRFEARDILEAMQHLEADQFLLSHYIEHLVSQDDEQMQAARGTMDAIINTLPPGNALHKDHVFPFTYLLKSGGKMIEVGDPNTPDDLPDVSLFLERKLFLGGSSATKQMRKTQEMIDFAADHNIRADAKVIPMKYVNEAMKRLGKMLRM